MKGTNDMNVQMQVCGLIILLLILYFYKRQDTVGLYTEALFRRALYTCMACLVLDILSVILIVNQDRLPGLLVRAECKMYLVSLVGTGYVALAYACADAFSLTKVSKFVKMIGAASAVAGIVIFLLPVNIFCEGRDVYTYGPACIATYIGAVVLLLATLFYTARSGNGMNPRRRRAIRIWMIIWLAAAVIQLMNSEILLVGFASALGIVVLFFELENPEANIDRKTGFFNARAFIDYVKHKYNSSEEVAGMLVSLDNAHSNDIRIEHMADIMAEVTELIRRIPETKRFKTDDREFTLVFDNSEQMERAYNMINQRFQREWLEDADDKTPVSLQPYYVLVPTGSVADDADEMLGFLRYFKAHCMDNPENHVNIIDENSVAKKKERDAMLATIVKAMEEDRVEVFFQPIYATHTKKFVSAEALVRIRREDGSIIPPGLFIPIAEETGLIVKLGERVFEKVCRFITKHTPEQYGVEYIEINLSVVQCEAKSLAKCYSDIMDKYKINPAFINLEITESASIVMRKTLLDNMKTLINYGVSFSLDDFGNGQSNLNYIVDMPVHIVKFDRDMTQAYFESEKARYVLQAATDMIQGLGLKVVAEGVETAEQLRELERLGIDYIQGYYFSKPIEADRYLEFLKVKNV
ncbi:MAG: EAL domain-containing protein [Lachnospiraceae bacterium]|nr:EAL domain-containing protein [Lachnospiraceae bacterium]